MSGCGEGKKGPWGGGEGKWCAYSGAVLAAVRLGACRHGDGRVLVGLGSSGLLRRAHSCHGNDQDEDAGTQHGAVYAGGVAAGSPDAAAGVGRKPVEGIHERQGRRKWQRCVALA